MNFISMCYCFLVVTTAQPPVPSGDSLFRDVVTYTNLGNHQTGSPGDLATSKWMHQELISAGLDAELQPWTFNRFDVERCAVEIGGIALKAYPFWFPSATGSEGIDAPLVKYDPENLSNAKGKLVFVPSSVTARKVYFTGINPIADELAAAGALGLIAAVGSGSGDLAAINARAPYEDDPLPLPCVIVATADENTLNDAASIGAQTTLVVAGRVHKNATANNVIGKLERGEKWVVVTTPISGWFTCAGERGPGIGLFLALARWAAASDLQYSFLFIGNSGHELDNLGAHASMDDLAPQPEEVALWIHLGASIATREWELLANGASSPMAKPSTMGNLVSTDALLPLVKRSFANVNFLTPRSGGMVAGELRHFMKAGYPAMGFFGAHHYFHTEKDTPATTEAAYLEPVGIGLVELLKGLGKR